MSEEEIIDILQNKLWFDEYEYGLSTDEEDFVLSGWDAQSKIKKALERFIRLISKRERKE